MQCSVEQHGFWWGGGGGETIFPLDFTTLNFNTKINKAAERGQ